MERLIDLHTHSKCSDGSLSPRELVRHGKKHGLSALALTDHDCVSGIDDAMDEAGKVGIELVPGIEFSARYKTECHILGFYIDHSCPVLLDALAEIQKVRAGRTEQTSKNLKKIGIDISPEEAASYAGGEIIGRAHFARAMVDKGYAVSVSDAFDRFLHVGRPGFSAYQLYTPQECIDIIHKSGGRAFVAHLYTTRLDNDELFDFLRELKEVGLDGIEGYYSEYSPRQEAEYLSMAKKLDLSVSGGTDFHGEMKPHIRIGVGRGNLRMTYSLLDGIKGLF